MKVLLVVAAAVVFSLSQGAAAQIPPSQPDLKGAVTDLVSAVAALPETLRSERLAAATQWLNNNYPKTKPENVSQEYARAIGRAAELLKKQPKAEVIDDVTRELEAKVEHCKVRGVGMGGSVLVRVNTRRGSSTVSDWQVLYLLKFDDWLQTAPHNFLRLSSPTDMSVEPGRYWVWARDPSTGRMSDRVLVQVAGQKEVTLDLPVP
jgi:hypothetical protein